MWKIRHEPRAYEYKVDPAPLPELVVHDEQAGVGMLLVAMLSAILDLPDEGVFSIEGGGKIETPQNTIAKS